MYHGALSPLLINILLEDLFCILNDADIENCANNDTPYAIADDINIVIASLEKE